MSLPAILVPFQIKWYHMKAKYLPSYLVLWKLPSVLDGGRAAWQNLKLTKQLISSTDVQIFH